MKTLLGVMLIWASVLVAPIPTLAQVDIHIGISLPPPFVFEAPPEVIVIPDTSDVYAVPDVDGDLFFWDGWWWRPWEGRWYRSHRYNDGWAYYDNVPSFYFDVDPGWRGYYREHDWYGHRWDYERIPPERLQQNWRSWQNSRHWEQHGTWGVQSYQPRPQPQRQELRHQREEQYRQNPEVQKHQQQKKQEQPRARQVQPPQEQRQPREGQPGKPQRQPHTQQPERQQPQQSRQPHAQQPERQQQPQQQQQPPRAQQPEKHQQPKQQHSQPRGQQQQRESQHPQSQGKPEKRNEGQGN